MPCAAALALPAGPAAAQSNACNKLIVTGHPQYPPFARRDGARIVGVAADMVEAIGKELGLPVESTYTGSWADAQAAARDGKVDVIFGIYFNDERARYLDYVKPAFTIDPVAVFVAKGTVFRFSGRQDLVGKKGVTNQGESYGVDFDNYMAQNLTVARTQGIDRAFDMVLKGEADYGSLSRPRRGGEGGIEQPTRGSQAKPGRGRHVCRVFQEIALPPADPCLWPQDRRDAQRWAYRGDDR